MIRRMWQRRGTAAEWAAANPILASGEIGVQDDTAASPTVNLRFKIGNGTDRWLDLPWCGIGALPPPGHDALAYWNDATQEYRLAAIGSGLALGSDVLSASAAAANVVRTESTTAASATGSGSIIPADNTIPQNTEGAAFASLDTTIVVVNAASTLRVTVCLPMVSASILTPFTCALFRDSGADAIAAQSVHITAAGGYFHGITMVRKFAAGASGSTTFKIRYGHNSSSGNTAYVNMSQAAAAYYGGVLAAFMEVEEILP